MMITTVERPDANALRRAVMQAPWWYSSMKLPAVVVLDLIEQLDAKGHVDQLWSEAPLGEHLGGGFRLYAQLPSITSFTRDIRAIATHQYLTCVDPKYCYPTILMHMYPGILSLKYYVDHRDKVLAETMRHYGVSGTQPSSYTFVSLSRAHATSGVRTGRQMLQTTMIL